MKKNYRYLNGLFLIVIALLFLVVFGCQRQEELPQAVASKEEQRPVSPAQAPPPAEGKGKPSVAGTAEIFNVPVKPVLVEEQANALPLWRQFADRKPVLLLFSAKILRSLPDVLHADVDLLLQQGEDRELKRRVGQPVPDQLLASDLGIAAAMRQGYFSKVIWVVPLEEGTALLPLVDFKQGLRARAAEWGSDAIDSFVETEHGAYSGVLGGVPVDVVSIDRLPTLKEPLLVHIDAAFFAATYRNEVKTPLHSMLSGQFRKIMMRGYRALTVTVSHDNINFEIPMTMRFLGEDIAAILADPVLMDKPSPAMKLRGEMRYLDSFFQPGEIYKKSGELQKISPRNADSYYNLYRALRQMHQLDKGLPALEKAVSLDPHYALEYFDLVNQAVQNRENETALTMLDSVIRALPGHALVKLRKAQLLVEMGRQKEALALLNELRKLPWSEFYYPRIRQDIEELSAMARQNN